MLTLNDASPQVVELIQNLGVKIGNYFIGPDSEGVFHVNIPSYAVRFSDTLQRSNGVYFALFDIVLYNRMPQCPILDRTLLHEVIHWTGHTRRLNRNYISNRVLTIEESHTEEVIAELGMLKLCDRLGIDTAPILGWSSEYFHIYYLADREHSERESNRAIDYILGVQAAKAA